MSAPPRIDTLESVLTRHGRERGEHPAIVSAHGKLTYAELERQVRACAASLRELGVGPGTTVGLLCTNRPEWIVGALGAIVAGARVAAFNTWSRRWDLDHLLRASGCDVLVALSAFGTTDLRPLLRELIGEAWEADGTGWRCPAYPALRELVLIGGDAGTDGVRAFDDLLAGEADDGECKLASRDDVALVLYTSGSTARPKAVPLQQGVALEHGFDVGARMGVTGEDRIWLAVPLFWSYGGANALMVSLAHGCTLLLQETFDAGAALALIERERCTVAYALPNITAALLAHPSFSAERVTSLTKGMTIGSQADVAAAARGLGIDGLCNAYGSTEIYGCCTATPHDWPLERKLASQGPPLPRIHLTVTDPESGAALAPGEVGEITVSGQVTRGYVDAEDLNARAFDADGAYHSGDLGHLDEEGNVVYAARATDMIKTGGINVAPVEVEELLLTHPDVMQVAVAGADDRRQGQVVVAFVVLTGEAAVGEGELRAFCRERIASFKVPACVVVERRPLPATSTGKLDRGAIRARADTTWAEHGT